MSPTPCDPTRDLTAPVSLFPPRAVGRKQFMRFEWANHAAEALGCEYEELNTATFKHHLRQIIEQVTLGSSQQTPQDQEANTGKPRTHPGDSPAASCSFLQPQAPGACGSSGLQGSRAGGRDLGPEPTSPGDSSLAGPQP